MLSDRIPTERYTFNLCESICLLLAVYSICYILSQDDVFPISISYAWSCFSHWAKHFHIIAVALLPVYVALMVFGTAIVGVYLGSAMQRWIIRLLS